VLLVADEPRREPVAEEVPPAIVPPVELLRVGSVHPLHAGRQRPELALDDQMEMGVHQAPRDHPPAALENLSREQREHEPALGIGGEDRRRPDPADRDVEEPVRR